MNRAAFIAYPGCALWQVSLLQMLLTRAGWMMNTLTVEKQNVKSDGGLTITATLAIEHAAPRTYQLVFMAGGDVSREFIENPAVRRFIRQYYGHGGVVAASCASSAILAAGGLLDGIRYAATPSTRQAFADHFVQAIFEDVDVVCDANIITSRGHAYIDFTAACLHRLGVLEHDPSVGRLLDQLGGHR